MEEDKQLALSKENHCQGQKEGKRVKLYVFQNLGVYFMKIGQRGMVITDLILSGICRHY